MWSPGPGHGVTCALFFDSRLLLALQDMVEDYIERNQDDFEEFSNSAVEMYEELNLDALIEKSGAMRAPTSSATLQQHVIKTPLEPPGSRHCAGYALTRGGQMKMTLTPTTKRVPRRQQCPAREKR